MIKLILTSDVSGLGHEGDVVEVADGYARNFLLPKSLAVKATGGALKGAERVRDLRQESLRKEREEAEALAANLVGSRVVVAARAADEGRLFGSIGSRDVAAAIEKYTGVPVAQRFIVLPQPIKEIGLHEVVIKPHGEVEFSLTLDVIPA
jgi:large subunit ribosomal protein L9